MVIIAYSSLCYYKPLKYFYLLMCGFIFLIINKISIIRNAKIYYVLSLLYFNLKAIPQNYEKSNNSTLYTWLISRKC